MICYSSRSRVALAILAVTALAALPPFTAADQPLITMRVQSNSLTFPDDGPAVLRMTGTATVLGKFTCYGEIAFVPIAEEDTLPGMGVVALQVGNGDLLVGVIVAQLDEQNRTLEFAIQWRDAVTFSDGTTVTTTGRFQRHRPPGGEKAVIIFG